MKLFHIALSFLVLAPVTAFAQEVPSSVAVSYGDLNLKSEAGVKVLDRRLESAIRSVCREHDGTAILALRVAAQRCVREKSAEVAALRDRAIASHSTPETLASR
jgi:UrcA family protein